LSEAVSTDPADKTRNDARLRKVKSELPSYVSKRALEHKVVRGVMVELELPAGAELVSGNYFSLLGVTKTLTGWHLVTLLPLVFALTMLSTAALNVAIDRVAYRPLRRSTRLARHDAGDAPRLERRC
jgi:hypothetical protein